MRPIMLAGSTETTLNFVRDTKSSAMSNDVEDNRIKLGRRSHGTADALNRFADEAGDLAGRRD